MNLADALRRVNAEGEPLADHQLKPKTAAPATGSEPDEATVAAAEAAHEAQVQAQAAAQAAGQMGHVPVFGDGAVPDPASQHIQPGNVVRLELFLSAEQMSGLFRAIMAGQHTVLTLREAAAFLRISQDSLQKLAEEGEIPGVHIEGRWRFPKANLEDWLTLQSATHEEGEDVA